MKAHILLLSQNGFHLFKKGNLQEAVACIKHLTWEEKSYYFLYYNFRIEDFTSRFSDSPPILRKPYMLNFAKSLRKELAMGRDLEIYMVIIMYVTAFMMLVLNIIEGKREKDEKKKEEEKDSTLE